MCSAFSSKPEKEEVQEKMAYKCFKSKSEKKTQVNFQGKIVKISNDLPSILQNNKGKKKYYPFQNLINSKCTSHSAYLATSTE